MILEDECMLSLGTAFWHLTCYTVRGTSVSFLLPLKIGKEEYWERETAV